jgi:Bacterial Ig-like domain (group 1)
LLSPAHKELLMKNWFALGRRTMTGLASVAILAVLAACGGGGGSAGDPVVGGGTDGGTTSSYVIGVQVERSGVATTQISSSETVQAVATVTSSSGTPVQGVVVAFSEASSTLLSFQPTSATALTDASGKASIDIAAASLTGTGATTVVAAATVASVDVTGNKSISISAGSSSVATPATVSFVSSSAQGEAIVLKGAGGNGRAETAILEFKVLDASGAPISGATVNFSINADNGNATISPTSAVSDSSGRITTTVLSGDSPASIVVVASSGSVSVQSDTLLVSNGTPSARTFEIVAEKYNLNGQLTGDTTTISAFIGDQAGNLVPDGVAVSFVTDYGAVGSSTLGGCTTVNGTCSVDFRVQEPRGDGLATVIGTVRVGSETTLSESLTINMASGPYVALNSSTEAVLTSVVLPSCKASLEALLSDGQGRSVAAGSTISVEFLSLSGATVSIKSGSPVLDQLGGYEPTLFGYEVDVSAASLTPLCNAAGTPPSTPQMYFRLSYQTPSGVTYRQRVDVYYPQ